MQARLFGSVISRYAQPPESNSFAFRGLFAVARAFMHIFTMYRADKIEFPTARQLYVTLILGTLLSRY